MDLREADLCQACSLNTVTTGIVKMPALIFAQKMAGTSLRSVSVSVVSVSSHSPVLYLFAYLIVCTLHSIRILFAF